MKRTKRGKVRFTDAMFPCYFFARLDLSQHLQQVNAARGVSRVVSYGSEFPVLPGQFLRELREQLEGDILFIAEPELKLETQLRVVRGPFQGLIGKLMGGDESSERLTILMELLGTEVSVKVPASDTMLADVDY